MTATIASSTFQRYSSRIIRQTGAQQQLMSRLWSARNCHLSQQRNLNLHSTRRTGTREIADLCSISISTTIWRRCSMRKIKAESATRASQSGICHSTENKWSTNWSSSGRSRRTASRMSRFRRAESTCGRAWRRQYSTRSLFSFTPLRWRSFTCRPR